MVRLSPPPSSPTDLCTPAIDWKSYELSPEVDSPLVNSYFNSRVSLCVKLTKRGEYALRALIHLGIAQEQGRALVPVAELAAKENMPVKFLEQILALLKQEGYLASKRGHQGGYFLVKPMKQIRMGEVVRRVDGPLAPISCVSQTAYERCSCPDEEHCGLRMLMLDVRNAIANILDRYTLQQTVDVTLRKLRQDSKRGLSAPTGGPRC